jgi:hypothetical protein
MSYVCICILNGNKHIKEKKKNITSEVWLYKGRLQMQLLQGKTVGAKGEASIMSAATPLPS